MQLAELTVYAQGRFARYDDSRIGLLSHGLNYGIGCFEGVRGFWSARNEELYLLQLADHYDRLAQSAGILMMRLPHTTAELAEITAELCVRNGFRSDVYLRPIVFNSTEDVGVRLHNTTTGFAIVAIPFERFFDTTTGLACAVSSWRRIDDAMAPVRGKLTGLYVNSALAKTEAVLNGFDEAIMLSADGHVSEGSAENLFMVRRGVIYTPDPSQNVLEGITRRTLIGLARTELGLTVVERPIDRSELYVADELCVTGSAAGVQWVKSVDRRPVGTGECGPVTGALIDLYERMVRGELPQYASWLTPAYASRKVPAAR